MSSSAALAWRRSPKSLSELFWKSSTIGRMQSLLGNSPFHVQSGCHLWKTVYKDEIVSFSKNVRQIHTATWSELTKTHFWKEYCFVGGSAAIRHAVWQHARCRKNGNVNGSWLLRPIPITTTNMPTCLICVVRVIFKVTATQTLNPLSPSLSHTQLLPALNIRWQFNPHTQITVTQLV